MAFGAGASQWPPHSSTSSSTLSPLAPPFTVDRPRPKTGIQTQQDPYDYGYSAAPAPDHWFQLQNSETLSAPPAPDAYPPPQATPLPPVGTDSDGRHRRGLPSGGSDWRRMGSMSLHGGTMPSNLVQAEPFYPKYGPAPAPAPAGGGSGLRDTDCFEERSDFGYVGTGAAPWNGPFDEESGWGKSGHRGVSSWVEPRGEGASRSSPWMDHSDKNVVKSSSWMESSSMGFALSYPASKQQDSLSNYENTWCSDQAEPCARKARFESDGAEAGNKPHVVFEGSVSAPMKVPGASVLFPLPLANSSSPHSAPPAATKELSHTFNSTYYPYYDLPSQYGSHTSENLGYYSSTTYTSKAQPFSTSPSKPIAVSKQNLIIGKSSTGLVDASTNNDHRKEFISIGSRKSNMSSDVKVDQSITNKDRYSNDMTRTDGISRPLEKENSSLGITSSVEEPRKSFKASFEPRTTNVSTSGAVEHDGCSQNFETLDQLSLAVDSPCWKGASTSRYSPFHGADSLSAPAVDQKFVDAISKGSITDVKTDDLSGDLESKTDILLSDELRSGFMSKCCNAATSSEDDKSHSYGTPASGNEIANSRPDSMTAVPDISSISHSNVNNQLLDSSSAGALDSDRTAGAPIFSHSSETLSKGVNVHYLVRSLYHLSAFLSSYSGDGSVLKGRDYDLLLLAKYNLDECFSKKRMIGKDPKGQSGYSEIKPLAVQTDGLLCRSSSKLAIERPANIQCISANVHTDKYDDLLCPNGYLEENIDVDKEIRKVINQSFCGPEKDSESKLYKKLWIEAEAALCKMKYELLARENVQSEDYKKNAAKETQGLSECWQKPEIGVNIFAPKLPLDSLGENNSDSEAKKLSLQHVFSVGEDSRSPKKPQDVAASDVHNTMEDVDASIMARLRILKDRPDNVPSLTVEQENKAQVLNATEVNVGLSQSFVPHVPPCSNSPLNRWTKFQPVQTGSIYGKNPWIFDELDARALEVPSGEPSGSDVLHHRAYYDKQSSTYSGNPGRREIVRESHASAGEQSIIEAYIPDEGSVNKFLGGRLGSTSSEWEHVLKEDATW